MEGGDYFDIDDILASQQTVLCRCEVNVPKLGFLDTANTNVDIRVGTKMDLPCWLAKGLSNKNRTVVSVEIARPYRASYRNVLEADAQIVNLSKFCLYYYDFGIHMLSFAGTEQREILQTLLQNWINTVSSLKKPSWNFCNEIINKLSANVEQA